MKIRPAGGTRHRGRKFRDKRLKTTLPRPVPEVFAAAPKDAERIAKVIARAGLCSRREAETWIAAGRVAVNGAKISSPALNVTAQDRISVDGKPLPARERTRLFLYHKPRGLVTTSADPQGGPTIFGALPKDLPRLISVGRLDLNTEGLLLLTNDGGLARALELPETGWLRRYRVRAHGRVTQSELDKLRHGITVDGIRYGAIEATLERAQAAQTANVWITFAMREGKNREIRNVLGALGLQVNRLIRVSFGPFQLGELPPGAVEEVKHARPARPARRAPRGNFRRRFFRADRGARSSCRSRRAAAGRVGSRCAATRAGVGGQRIRDTIHPRPLPATAHRARGTEASIAAPHKRKRKR